MILLWVFLGIAAIAVALVFVDMVTDDDFDQALDRVTKSNLQLEESVAFLKHYDPIDLALREHQLLSADRDGLSEWNHPRGCPVCHPRASRREWTPPKGVSISDPGPRL